MWQRARVARQRGPSVKIANEARTAFMLGHVSGLAATTARCLLSFFFHPRLLSSQTQVFFFGGEMFFPTDGAFLSPRRRSPRTLGCFIPTVIFNHQIDFLQATDGPLSSRATVKHSRHSLWCVHCAYKNKRMYGYKRSYIVKKDHLGQ